MINVPNPETRVWNQPNASDLLGNIWVTKNITFDQQGYLTLSNSPRAIITEATSSFDNVAAMVHNTDYDYFVATWDAAWSIDDAPLSDEPTLIATAGVPSTDIETGIDYANSLLVVSQDTDVDFYNATSNAWTDTNITLTSNGQHDVVLLLSLNAIAIINVNTIGLYDAASFDATPDLITTLSIPTNFEITKVIYHNQNLYIGTQNMVGTKAAMYVWNGQGTAAQQAYQVDSNMIFSVCAHEDDIYALLGNGALMVFNGGGFDVAAALPIYFTDMALSDYVNQEMYKDIMRSNGYVLFINFANTENTRNALTYQPDGVWCYDKRVGLYHRYANTIRTPLWDTILTADVNTTTNQITVTTATPTGTEVYYQSPGTVIPELLDETKYYVIKVDGTHIKLAYTYAEAIAGTEINLTGTGNNSQRLVFFPNIDFGQFYSDRPTAVLTIDLPSVDRQYGTDILWGTEVYRRDALSSVYGTLMTASATLSSRGYFVIPKVFSGGVTDNYNKITYKWSPFTSELDKIIIKYRTEDDMRNIINVGSADWSITWTSTTTFTVTPETDVWDEAEVGDEVEILRGAGGGLLAHILSKTGTTTLTITLDDSYPDYASGDVGKAIFRNWKKWKTITSTSSEAEVNYLSDHIGQEGQFLQLKTELRGVQTQIVELLVNNVSRLPAGRTIK